MLRRLPATALALALVAILYGPALATLLAALGLTDAGPSGGGLLDPGSAGGLMRPARLALESIRLVLATSLLAVPAGLVLALVLFRTDAWGRRGLLGLLTVAAFVPMPLHAMAWLGGFGNAGRAQALGSTPWLFGWTGAAFVHAMASIPWVALLAGVGLRTVEPELEESAVLDRPAWRVAIGIGLRRSLGATLGAILMVGVLTAGDMTVTDQLQVRTYAEESYLQYQLGQGPAAAAHVALPPLAVLGGLVLLASTALIRAEPARLASAAAGAKLWRLGRWRVPVGVALVLTAGNALALPLYGLVWRAGRVGGSAREGIPPRWSFEGLTGTLARSAGEVAWPLAEGATWAALGACAATALAWGLAWMTRRPGPWRAVAAFSAALALAAPGPVAGMAVVLAYRRIDWIYDTGLILTLTHTLRTFPFALLVLWPAVRSIPPEYLDAAAVDGLGPWGVFRRVAWPLALPATVAAWCVAFVLALGELPAANLVAPPGINTATVVVWHLMHYGVESRLAGVGLVLLGTVGLAAGLAARALGRVYLADGSGDAPVVAPGAAAGRGS